VKKEVNGREVRKNICIKAKEKWRRKLRESVKSNGED
jgi:hypothetical protein